MSYRFINKENGEVKLGNLTLAGEGYDEFTCEDGTVITVKNEEMDASNLQNDEYDIELVEKESE